MTPPPRTLPVVVGTTENALRSLLLHTLDETPLAGYEQWVALNLLDRPSNDELDDVEAVRGRLGLEPARAVQLLDDLATTGLVTRAGTRYGVSTDGSALLATLRPSVAAVSRRVVQGLPDEDVATAMRVLDQVRSNAELMRRGH